MYIFLHNAVDTYAMVTRSEHAHYNNYYDKMAYQTHMRHTHPQLCNCQDSYCMPLHCVLQNGV